MPLYHSCAGSIAMPEATTLCITTVGASWRPNQPHQDTLHLLYTHVHILNHSSIEHTRRNIPPPTLLLQVVEALENDTFPVGETVSNIGKMLTDHGYTYEDIPP